MVVAKPETKKINYPVFPERNWWTLRKRFNQRMPGEVNASYLADVLEIGDDSAKNLIAPLKKTGLISEDGVPTDRAYDWTNDEQYPSVCEQIRSEIYPPQIRNVFFDLTSFSRIALEKRLKSDTRVGEQQARHMAAFYLLLLQADPTKQDTASSNPTKQTARANKAQSPTSKGNTLAAKRAVKGEIAKANGFPADSEESKTHPTSPSRSFGPSFHFNVQIHISPDASVEQIDQTLASMARHFATFLRQGDE